MSESAEGRIRLGISSCLLGNRVRYDGGHKLDTYLRDVLGTYVDYVPVCPEVELGLPIPREALRLVARPDGEVRLVFSRSGGDITEPMRDWARRRVAELEPEQLDGFIFKAKSPSSGMERVKLYDGSGMPRKQGVGLFAGIFMEHFPLLPVEEDGRLNDAGLRENFIASIFTLQRLRHSLALQPGLGSLVAFHSRHKLLLLSRSPQLYRELGRLVATAASAPFEDAFARYRVLLLKALKTRPTVKKHINVLQHILGYFKQYLSADEKQEALELIEQYRAGLVPLIVPVTLLNHFVRKYDNAYLRQQVYLQPHPRELKLLNHV